MRSVSPFIFLAGIAILAGCSKDTIEPEKLTSSQNTDSQVDYTVVNGRLVFTDNAAFKSVMTSLNSSDQATVTQWDSQNGITSLSETYRNIDQAAEAEDPAYLTVDTQVKNGTLLWVPDSRFAAVVNAEGVFQIGQEIHKITQCREYNITNGSEEILTAQQWTDPAVQFKDLRCSFTVENDTATASNTAQRSFWGWRERDAYRDVNGRTLPKTSNNRSTRLRGVHWDIDYIAYSSIGMRTVFQKDIRFGGWGDHDADYVLVSGEVDLSPGGVRYGYGDRYNNDEIDRTLAYAAFGGIYNYNYFNSMHRGTYKGANISIVFND